MKSLTPNNSGKKYLTNHCRKIQISDYLNRARAIIKEIIINSQLENDGVNLDLIFSKTNYNGKRYWLKCPICNRIYQHPISQVLGCRKCLNLEYRSRRYKGMVEGDVNIGKG